MLNTIISTLITALISGACGYFWSRVQVADNDKKKAKESKENETKELYGRLEKVENATRAILHEMILQKCNEILIRGYVTPNEIDEIEYLFKPYEAENGNGRAKNAVDMCYKLPRRENIEEE